MAKASVSDSKQRKLEKKRKKEQEKRRKRINARIDRTIAFMVIMIYVAYFLLEAKACLDTQNKNLT